MKRYFEVGDKVSHQSYGDGEIIDIDNFGILKYPVKVKFKSFGREDVNFTKNGYESEDDPFPSLSQKKHVPLEYVEKSIFNKGDMVWVNDSGYQDCNVRYFSHVNVNGRFECFDNQCKEGSTSSWENISEFEDIPI